MKIQRAQLNYLKMAPRKVRLISSLIRGLSVNDAQAQLLMHSRRASQPILKLLQSAINNAVKINKMEQDKLFIKEIRVDQGPMLKRWMPRAMGRATPIQKKSSHVILVLAESEKAKPVRFKIEKREKIKKPKNKKAAQKEEKPEHQEEKEKAKPVEGRGFKQRIFSRKSV